MLLFKLLCLALAVASCAVSWRGFWARVPNFPIPLWVFFYDIVSAGFLALSVLSLLQHFDVSFVTLREWGRLH